MNACYHGGEFTDPVEAELALDYCKLEMPTLIVTATPYKRLLAEDSSQEYKTLLERTPSNLDTKSASGPPT